MYLNSNLPDNGKETIWVLFCGCSKIYCSPLSELHVTLEQSSSKAVTSQNSKHLS
ncbi:Hypothetical protein PP7435_CHR1-2577 [Komagataella phaffii CBS 7435]|uniref:Uncharacterized protein n=1 Tax=Komagataella phaffii (strain ATCC 76273 / CBS 7435 / CECT 11047 / NRRL Y-11430 / Wegner 21-1) TaxID=981350 RepID=A0A1G4KPE0_KOMPC|nr:Hypothetical protein BQ9382_C1-4358 [Komagataella phaffii CBS 7435]SCV11860.1 Hypothetical protein PP7435_CHR1-2577 [Komagataella phaffii CBS 7435]